MVSDRPEFYVAIEKLPGEGKVSDEIRGLERRGQGVILQVGAEFPSDQPNKGQTHQLFMAAKTGFRIHQSLAQTNNTGTLKVLLFTHRQIWNFINDPAKCTPEHSIECRPYYEMGGSSVFDMVRFYEDYEYPPLPQTYSTEFGIQQWPKLWLMRIVTLMHSPFELTMAFDTDVYVCNGFEKMFDVYLDKHHLFAATFDPPFFGINGKFRAFLRDDLPDVYRMFPERNAGMMLMNTGNSRIIDFLALFRDVYVRHMTDPVAFSHCLGDQPALREALFTMRRFIHDNVIPLSIGCRYKDWYSKLHAMCTDTCLTVHRKSAFADHGLPQF
jgi:hypothetical protein